MKTFWKNVITGDETWVYGYDVETKVQSSQWVGKSSPRPKKSTSVSLKCEGDDDSFLIGRVLFIMKLFHVVRQSIKSFTWRSWSVWGKQGEERGLRRGQTRPGCCTMTMHLPTRRFLFVNFWRSKRRLSCSSPLLTRFGPCGLFPVPKVEIYPKRSPISDGRGDKRKSATGPSRHPAKHVPELGKTLGAAYQQ